MTEKESKAKQKTDWSAESGEQQDVLGGSQKGKEKENEGESKEVMEWL